MNDERNTASGSWARMPSIIARKRSPLPHRFMRAQQTGRRVLQREVEVRHDRGQLEHRRDERVVHFRRVEVEQPDTREAVRRQRVEAAQQRRERTGLADVAAVPREVLRDEHDLGDAGLDERPRLRLRSTRSSATAACRGTTGSRRTRTRGRSPRRPSRTPTARSARAAAARAGRARRPACGAARQHDVGDRALAREPDHRVGLGQRRRELVAVALGHATGDARAWHRHASCRRA